MRKMYKAMLLVLCAVLLVAGSVMGTLAYLQMQTTPVTNTMSVGKVTITLQEYGIDNATGEKTDDVVDKLENIKLVPGRKIEKNPFITVGDDSEDCYLFVQIVNGLGDAAYINMVAGWTRIDETDYWMYSARVPASERVEVFDYFTCSTEIQNGATWTDSTITITAYAVQAEGFTDTNGNGTAADEAWAASGFGA